MSEYEILEITSYPDVYYVGHNADKPKHSLSESSNNYGMNL
jgi:hypothetical protein